MHLAPLLLAVCLPLAACDEGPSIPDDAAAPAADVAVEVGGRPGDAMLDAMPDAIDAMPDAMPNAMPDAIGAMDAMPDAMNAIPDASPDVMGAMPDAAPDGPPPARILFIGNSFTFGGPVPAVVDTLAVDAGWPDPEVVYSAFGGESLSGHRHSRPQTLERVDEGGWDVVVLQELSTRPTDNAGDPPQFKDDATWFFDRVKASSPDARVVLYETWARHPDHAIYPARFANPAEMQAQLRFHYTDAAERYLPEHAQATVEPAVVVAPAGDAWEAHLAEPDPLRLHADDDYHAAATGQYLNGLVIYSTLYDRAVTGLTPWRVAPAEAARLQATVDRLTGRRVFGGPDGVRPARGLRPGQVVQVDVGDDDVDPGWPEAWNGLTDAVSGGRSGLRAADGEPTSVSIRVARAFGGVNGQGLADNGLGLPGGATRDSFFCGSFDDHADGLTRPGRLRLDGLDPAGGYRLTLFASRAGTDGALGRLTRYAVGEAWVDLEVSDNRDRVATFEVAPDDQGGIDVEVAVSPAGGARFCYVGAVVVERTR